MKKFILPILACLAVGITSCESMLDIPQKGVVSYDSFYANDDDAHAALVNMYKQYINNVAATEGIDVPEQVLLNYAADDILAAGADFSDHIDFRVFDEFKYDNANKVLKNAYNRYLYSIYHANLVISNFTTENRYATAPKWESEYTKQCVAEARVMRAYLHLMLALSWNTPPILDRVYNPDEAIVSAESQSKVLEWVIQECDKAITSGYLPKRNGKTDKDATARMSVGFAQFIAGKAAVFNNDMATARKYLGDLINSGDYDLVASEDFWTNFHIAGDGNSETIFEPNLIDDPAFTAGWGAMMIGRWMVANVFCWRTDALASSPLVHIGNMGWNGGAVQEDFAERFLAHDGNSPRRLACFLTEDEWLYEMDWSDSEVNDGTLAEKKADPKRGISSANGVFGHGKFFEWKHMVYINPPKILTGGKEYPADNLPNTGPASNQTNYGVARYAEALLLYAEACIGSSDAAKGLAALNKVQERSGSGKISSELTIQNVIEEKQYELWFEGCRFHDVIRWGQLGYLNTDDVFNKSKIHQEVPTVYDAFFTIVNGHEDLASYKGKEHHLYTVHTAIPAGGVFEKGRHEYYPFPLDVTKMNPNLTSYGAWGK
jgi:hypothetical protein